MKLKIKGILARGLDLIDWPWEPQHPVVAFVPPPVKPTVANLSVVTLTVRPAEPVENKETNMGIAQVFTGIWKEAKSVASKVETFLVKSGTVVQTVVKDAEKVVVAVDPALAPAVTAFDAFEEAIVGKLIALANDAQTAPSVQALFVEEWASIEALVQQFKNHPAAVAAVANPTV